MENNINWLEYENDVLSKGYRSICGVDEAGRGPLAGPVCAAAVILPENTIIEGVNDSKKLSEKKREALFDVIRETAISYSIAYSTVEEIESLNILNATMLAMKRAVEGLDVKADFAMIDGNRLPELDIPAEYIIKGDAKSMSIACASILAKVSRDRLLYEYAKEYPEYQFDKHKGYGTKVHVEALKKYGPCPYHRMSFLTKILK
jgi:ribonuclease HII